MAAPDITVEVTTEIVSVEVAQAPPVTVDVQMGGAPGPQGPQGATGPTGPAGANGTGDLHFEQDFLTTTTVDVHHNLGKRPAVTVIDSAGDECIGDIDHLSNNELMITFSAAFSGKVICN